MLYWGTVTVLLFCFDKFTWHLTVNQFRLTSFLPVWKFSWTQLFSLQKKYSVILTTSFWWHESEDTNKNVISKISVDVNFCIYKLCLMCIGITLSATAKVSLLKFLWQLLLFHTEMISSQFFWANMLLGGESNINWSFYTTSKWNLGVCLSGFIKQYFSFNMNITIIKPHQIESAVRN